MNPVVGVIILMIVVSFAFYFMAVYDVLWLFFLGNFLIGITNAGVRILRTTYIFNHVPNNLIGRTNSVFNTLNIVARMVLIGLFALPFFQADNNIRYGYFAGVIMMLMAITTLVIWYRRIVSFKNN